MKHLVLAMVVVFLLTGVMFAEGKAKSQENWKEIQGVYLGKATVTNDIGAVLRTGVRVQIRHGKKKHFIVEMVYFDTKVAKFTKCARLEEYKINIYDEVEVDGKSVQILGTLASEDGKLWNGTIRFFLMTTAGKKAIRTFVIEDLKKASAY